jgi:hypothetical protein
MIENKNETTVETVASVDIPKVKKPRTEKQLAATAKLLENNKMKRELLKKHKESLENVDPVVPVVPVSVAPVSVVPPPPPIDIDNEIVVPKVKKVYKKRVKPDEKPKVLPPPLEYSDSSSSEEEMEYHQHPPTKPKRLARRFRIH